MYVMPFHAKSEDLLGRGIIICAPILKLRKNQRKRVKLKVEEDDILEDSS